MVWKLTRYQFFINRTHSNNKNNYNWHWVLTMPRDYAEYFTCIDPVNHHNNPLRWLLVLSYPLTDKNRSRMVKQLTQGYTAGWWPNWDFCLGSPESSLLSPCSAASHILGWPKSPCGFLHKRKDTFFIFTNNYRCGYFEYVVYLLLWATSGWRPVLLLNIFQCMRQPHSKELFGQNVNSTVKLHKPLLTHSFSHSTSSIHCTNLFSFFFAFQWHFYLSWNNKA